MARLGRGQPQQPRVLWIPKAPAGNDISAAGALSITGSADLDATGALLAAGALSITGAADLDASGSLLAAGALSIIGAADLDATGALTAAGTLVINGAADLDAIGQLTAAGSLVINGVADLTSSGANDLLAVGTLSITGVADLDAVGQLTVLGTLVITGVADLSGPIFAAPEVFSGGFFREFDVQRARRRRKLKELQEAEDELQSLKDQTDREIALLLKQQERLDTERDERERLRELAKRYTDDRAEKLYGERVAKAMARAAIQGNFSAIEALMREIERSLEEERFLIEATILFMEES